MSEMNIYRNYKKKFLKDNAISAVIKEKQIYAVYQPICYLDSGEVYGYEGLSRTSNPVFSNIIELIEIAKMKNKLDELDLLMMEKVICDFRREGKLFVNVESKSMEAIVEYIEKMIQVIKKAGISTESLVLELSERENWDPESLHTIRGFAKKYKFLLAIDDFGAGFSNVFLLLELQPNIVKIDRRLVRGIDKDVQKYSDIKTFLEYARRCDMKVICEGIELEEDFKVLKSLGGVFGQGHYFGELE